MPVPRRVEGRLIMKKLFTPFLAASVVLLTSACEKVELSEAGQTAALAPQGLTAKGEPVDAEKAKFMFASSDGQVATVDPMGKVTAVKSGSVTITTTSGEVSAKTPVEVSIPKAIVLTGAPYTLTGLGSEMTLASVVNDDAERPLTGAKVEYASADPNVVAVEGNKLIAKAVGSTTLTAVSGALKQTAEVSVKLPEVATVAFETVPAALKVGENATVVPVAKSAEGTNIQGVAFTYTSSNDKVATVDASGVVTAVKAGTATLKAEGGGKSAEVELTVKKK